jgi:hypothetical protein
MEYGERIWTNRYPSGRLLGREWSVRRNSDIPLSWWSMKITVLFDISGPDDGGSTHL